MKQGALGGPACKNAPVFSVVGLIFTGNSRRSDAGSLTDKRAHRAGGERRRDAEGRKEGSGEHFNTKSGHMLS